MPLSENINSLEKAKFIEFGGETAVRVNVMNNSSGSSISNYGRINIPIFQNYVDVSLSNEMFSTDYVISVVIETDDTIPSIINYFISNKTTTGFKVKFNTFADSDTYFLSYSTIGAIVGNPDDFITNQQADEKYYNKTYIDSNFDYSSEVDTKIIEAIADIPAPDLSSKANVSGQVFTGAISAPNLSNTNTGDETETSLITKLSNYESIFNPSKTMFDYEDFNKYLSYYTSAFTTASSNGGSIVAGTSPTGSIILKTNTSANGGMAIRKIPSIYLGYGVVIFECSITIGALDATNDYLNSAFGLHNGTSYIPGDGCYFMYNNAYSTTKWVASSSQFSGGRQGTDTVTSVNVVAGTPTKLRIVITNTTEAKYYINGVLVATHTTRIPPNTTALGPAFSARQAGSVTTNRDVSLDYYLNRYELTAER